MTSVPSPAGGRSISPDTRAALIVADGDLELPALQRATAELAGTDRVVIAADGGALRALAFDLRPDLVLGDGDSLGPDGVDRLRAAGIPVRLSPREKEESDAQLCMLEAVTRGATRIRLVGMLGGPRVEHEIANLLLLGLPSLDGRDVAIVTARSRLWRIGTQGGPGATDFTGAPGDHVSLLPLDGVVEGVQTSGLRYRLSGESLEQGPARGLSNEMTARAAGITTQGGRLLVVHTLPLEEQP